MSDKQKVTDASFNAFKSSMEESSQAFTANLRTLVNAIENVSGRWQGRAHDAFVRAQTELNDEHDAVRRLIDDVREAVALTHKNASANDGDIASRIKGVDVSGGAQHTSGESALNHF